MSILSTKNVPAETASKLDRIIAENLSKRISASDGLYNNDEIQTVRDKECKLFPRDYLLNKEETEQYRALAVFSRCSLPGTDTITSHRPIIGPVIVAVKKVAYAIFSSQLGKICRGVEQYQARLLVAQAQNTVLLRELRQ